MLHAFDIVRSGLYHHGRRKRGQAISLAYRDVLGVILSFAVKHGRAYPTLATIARAAMCSTRTVLRALTWLELFGFLGRIRRLTRVRTRLGTLRAQQTSNAYRLTTRLSGLGAMALNVFAGRERHHCARSSEKWISRQESGQRARPFGHQNPFPQSNGVLS
jgi:Helix-turn-helix domain